MLVLQEMKDSSATMRCAGYALSFRDFLLTLSRQSYEEIVKRYNESRKENAALKAELLRLNEKLLTSNQVVSREVIYDPQGVSTFLLLTGVLQLRNVDDEPNKRVDLKNAARPNVRDLEEE